MLPTRPVIPGFHPDPSICRVGDVYYLACSSFEYAPGVPIFQSTDLRSWQQIGHALHRDNQLALEDAEPSGGVYAPTLRHHAGRFWLITTNVSGGAGQLLVTAENPRGPWSAPVMVPDAIGIDPDLAWDEGGACLLTWSGEDESGRHGIMQALLHPATGALLDKPQQIWRGTGGKYPEGPHIYRIGGSWYLLISEGGTERGHAVTVARAPSPSGPFVPAPDNPVLTARGSSASVQSTGHADLVQRSDESWAAVYLGTRPRGHTPGWHVLGRETFASEVRWEAGWPRIAEAIEPTTQRSLIEELPGAVLPFSWVAANHFPKNVMTFVDEVWHVAAAATQPTFVGRRQEHFFIRAQADLDPFNGVGALELRIDPRHQVQVTVDGSRARCVIVVGQMVTCSPTVDVRPGDQLEIRTVTSPAAERSTERGPDQILAGVSRGSGFVELGRLDGRYLSTEVAGGFTGRFVGVSCSRGTVRIATFTYTGSDTLH